MLFLDAIIRFPTAGLLCLIVFSTLRDQRATIQGWLLALLSISLMALLFSTAPHAYGHPKSVTFIFQMMDVPNTILAWLFIKSLVDDNFKMTSIKWLICALWCIPLWLIRLDYFGYYDIFTHTHVNILNSYALCLFIYLAYHILKGRKDDLVEPRRRLRFIIVIIMICAAIASILSEFFLPFHQSSLFKNTLFLGLAITTCLWMFQTRPRYLMFTGSKAHNSALWSTLTPKDILLNEKLLHAMVQEKAWLEPDLTIPKLSSRLAVTEHRLRKLINQSLGYRNFSSYVNGYRIEAVKDAFNNPDMLDTPILTIALNSGFNSLTPFNRAFKGREGVTPKAYRSQISRS